MTDEINPRVKDQQGAVFNMAIAQLQMLNGILKNIAMLGSVYFESGSEEELSPGKAQHIKYRWVRQLFIQSTPLLDIKTDAEWKKTTYEKVKNVKLTFLKKCRNNEVVGYVESYNSEIENLLDDIVMEIQERLQCHKYFMPPKNDVRFAWSQD